MNHQELPERTATPAELAAEHARFVQARIDGSIHDDRATAPPERPAFVSIPWPKLDLGCVVTFDMVADSGAVALQCGNVSIHLHSEEQARALIAAAGQAAAMFARAQMLAEAHADRRIVNPDTHVLHTLPDVAQQADMPVAAPERAL